MNNFTKGEWLTVEPNTGFVYCLDESGDRNQFQFCIQGNGRNGATPKELAANATLCATAGTTATKLAERGYDAIKVLELLPMITGLFSDNYRSTDEIAFIIEECLKECRSDV